MIGDRFPSRVILHWFSGSLRVTEQAISFGLFFSINPAMVTSDQGRRIIGVLPRDRILTESDGPFVAADGRPAEPGDVSRVITYLAREWRTEEADVRRQVSETLRGLRADSPTDAWPPRG
jgi:TatD DNase family protein